MVDDRADSRPSGLTSGRRAFGERLRRHRERQQITLQAIADVTKIAPALFAGLERGDCGRWPGGMYNRAFVRAYAAAVRLDPDSIAAEFAEHYHDADAEPPAKGVPVREAAAPRPPACPPLRLAIEVDPAARVRRVAQRVLFFVMETVLAAVFAAASAWATGGHFWMYLSIVTLAILAVSRLTGVVFPGEAILTVSPQTQSPRPDEAASDPAVAATNWQAVTD